MEGIEMQKDSDESSSDPNDSSKGDTDDLGATKDKRKKSTKKKRKEALEKKQSETLKSKNDPTVVADFSREDSQGNEADGSRREMINQADSVQPDETDRGAVGNKRFDANEDGADELPKGDEEGGGFF